MLNGNCDTCIMDARTVQDRAVGSIFVDIEHESKNVKRWGVYVQGDGTGPGDTTCIAITWNEELAGAFADILKYHPVIEIASMHMQIFRLDMRMCPTCGFIHHVGKAVTNKKL